MYEEELAGKIRAHEESMNLGQYQTTGAAGIAGKIPSVGRAGTARARQGSTPRNAPGATKSATPGGTLLRCWRNMKVFLLMSTVVLQLSKLSFFSLIWQSDAENRLGQFSETNLALRSSCDSGMIR